MSRIRERDGSGRDVVQLDELGQFVFVGAAGRHHFRRVIHDLADDDRADERIRVRRADTVTEVLHARRAVLAERALTQRGEFFTHAGEVTADGHALFCRAKAGLRPIARERTNTGRVEIHLITTSGAERERHGQVQCVELVLVKHHMAARRDHGVRREDELDRVVE